MDLYEFTDKSTLRKAENRIKTFENLIDIFDKQLECDKHTKSLVFQYIQENLIRENLKEIHADQSMSIRQS